MENRLTDILEAPDFCKPDQVLRFLGQLIDVLCSDGEIAEPTAVLALHADFASFLFKSLLESF